MFAADKTIYIIALLNLSHTLPPKITKQKTVNSHITQTAMHNIL